MKSNRIRIALTVLGAFVFALSMASAIVSGPVPPSAGSWPAKAP